jgi:hypothetical protein
MLFLAVIAVAFVAVCIEANPYRVPLQGNAGGKRTLVIFDDLVRSHAANLFSSSDVYFFCSKRQPPILYFFMT